MLNRMTELLMEADIGAEIRPSILDVVGILVDGSGLKVIDLATKTGIPMEHAMAICGNRNCHLSVRSVTKVLALFNIRISIVAE
jgi:hypothetical protein